MDTSRKLLLRLAAFLTGLISSSTALTASIPNHQWVEANDPTATIVAIHAQRLAQELVQTLSTEVSRALAAGGPSGAIGSCHLKALPLTTAVATSGAPTVLAIKRTSLKVRNPANAPDPAEQAALERIADLLAQKRPLPATLIQRLDAPNRPTEWRVYRPLWVAPPASPAMAMSARSLQSSKPPLPPVIPPTPPPATR